jgi:hypothetical protein
MTTVYNLEKEAAVASLADADLYWVYRSATKNYGSCTLANIRQATSAGLANVTTATVTIDTTYAGDTITLNRAGGIAVTLPAATGSGNKYKFVVGTTFTSAGTIKVVGNDTMIGTATLYADGGATVVGFAAGGTDDTITFAADNSTGGIAGCMVELQDIAADLWHVNMVSDAANSEVTPFSATVAP